MEKADMPQEWASCRNYENSAGTKNDVELGKEETCTSRPARSKVLVKRSSISKFYLLVVLLWFTCLTSVVLAMRLCRRPVQGHLPPHMIPRGGAPLILMCCFLWLLAGFLAPLVWMQLRDKPLWGRADLAATITIYITMCFSCWCVLTSRERPTSLWVVIGSTLFGLTIVSVPVLMTLRAVFIVVSICLPSAQRFRVLTSRLAMFAIFIVSMTSFAPPLIRGVDVFIPGLPILGDGYTICMISDLHAGPDVGPAWVRKIASKLTKMQCNVIVFNGDMAEGTVPERAEEMAELLPVLGSSPDGVYYVPGNHEFYNFAAPGGAKEAAISWTNWWASKGVRSLNNTRISLPLGSSPFFSLVGVDDLLGSPDLNRALGSKTNGRGDSLPTILMSHRPSPNAVNAADRGVALQISGHTHGGQLWPCHLFTERMNEGYISGLYDVSGMKLYVSDGSIGSYMTRIRFMSRSEITRVTLHSHKFDGFGDSSIIRPARYGGDVARICILLGAVAIVVVLVRVRRLANSSVEHLPE